MSLTKQLRAAAIERSRQSGDAIDCCVIELDGVIDLRELDDSEVDRPSTRPAEALINTIGGFEHEMDITDLYCAERRHLDFRVHRQAR